MAHLHVLNGDATLHSFEKTGIEGERMVWREVLSEGKVPETIGAEPFWKVRSSFFESFFEIEEEEYHELTVEEFEKVEGLSQYEEITFWFEYDLFCQMNLMALLSWFARQELGGVRLSLVCSGTFPGYSRLVGLGEIDPDQYQPLFEQRQYLKREDLDFAQQFWAVFSSDDPTELHVLAQSRAAKFPYLPAAVHAHLQRFPSVDNGLNIIEDRMIRLVHSGVRERKKLIGQIMKEDQYFGFGDAQYFTYLKNLYPLLEEEDGLSVNELGAKVLEGKEDFIKWAQHDYYWGGVHFKSYRWDKKRQKLIRMNDRNKKDRN